MFENQIIVCPECAQLVKYVNNKPNCINCGIIDQSFINKHNDEYKQIINNNLNQIKRNIDLTNYNQALNEINLFINKDIIKKESSSYYMFDLFKVISLLKIDYDFNTNEIKVFDNTFSDKTILNNNLSIISNKLTKYKNHENIQLFKNLSEKISSYYQKYLEVELKEPYEVYYYTDKLTEQLIDFDLNVYYDNHNNTDNDYLKHKVLSKVRVLIVDLESFENTIESNYIIKRFNQYKRDQDKEILIVKTNAYNDIDDLRLLLGITDVIPKTINSIEEALKTLKLLFEYELFSNNSFIKELYKLHNNFPLFYSSKIVDTNLLNKFDNLVFKYKQLLIHYKEIYGNLPKGLLDKDNLINYRNQIENQVINNYSYLTNNNENFLSEIIKLHNEGRNSEAYQKLLSLESSNNYLVDYYIGLFNFDGIGTHINYQKAYSYFLKAKEGNISNAYVHLGYIKFQGLGFDVDYEEALNWFLKGSKLDNKVAEFSLALMYEEGLGTLKDFEQAYKYYLKSALNMNHNAKYKLGMFYLNGINKEKDISKAHNWFLKSANLGNKDAQYELGKIYESGNLSNINYSKAFKYYLRSASQNHNESLNKVGYYYQKGITVDVDYNKAYEFYQKSISFKNSDALNNMGYLYLNGMGVKQDFKKAFKYFEEASNLGNNIALLNLGHCYLNGIGIKRSKDIAYEIFNKTLKEDH